MDLQPPQPCEPVPALQPGASDGGESPWSDPAIARALNMIHRDYAGPIDIEHLSKEAGLSRTMLRERFARLIGEPPMRYCARWRLRMAAVMLRDTERRVSDIAFAVGFGSEEAFSRAFRRLYGQPPACWRRSLRESRPGSSLPHQILHQCTARDGTRLAWSEAGAGFPLVKTANWLNHLDFDWESPVWRHWIREMMRENRLIRYDERGNGMSDWNPPFLSFDTFVDDLETIVEAAGVDQFDLVGISQGAAVAVAYSLRHPGRIRRMVLLGGYARGWGIRLKGEDLARREAMVTLTKTGWGSDNPAYRQMFTSLYIPGGTAEQLGWWNELQKISATPANAVRLQRVFATIDVSHMLERVTVPTLVAHARRDHVIGFEAGEELAAGIKGSTFLPLDSDNHVLLEHEPAWQTFVTAMRRFLKS